MLPYSLKLAGVLLFVKGGRSKGLSRQKVSAERADVRARI